MKSLMFRIVTGLGVGAVFCGACGVTGDAALGTYGAGQSQDSSESVLQATPDLQVYTVVWGLPNNDVSTFERYFGITAVRGSDDTVRYLTSLHGVLGSWRDEEYLKTQKDYFRDPNVRLEPKKRQLMFLHHESDTPGGYYSSVVTVGLKLAYDARWEDKSLGLAERLIYDNALVTLPARVDSSPSMILPPSDTNVKMCAEPPTLGSILQMETPLAPWTKIMEVKAEEVQKNGDTTIFTLVPVTPPDSIKTLQGFRGSALTQSGCIVGIVAEAIQSNDSYKVYAVRGPDELKPTAVLERGHQTFAPVTPKN